MRNIRNYLRNLTVMLAVAAGITVIIVALACAIVGDLPSIDYILAVFGTMTLLGGIYFTWHYYREWYYDEDY